MAEIRELVTLFTFKVEEAGLNKYKGAIGGIKELAKSAAAVFGLAFGAEKIYSFVEGLVDAGKELNRTIYQIQRMARDQDDFSNIQQTLLDSATMLGVSYTDVADTFKEMLRESQDLKNSQEEVLTVTQNIYKAARVEKLTGEQTKEVLGFMNTMFRRGGLMSERAVNTLNDMSRETMKVLMDAYGQTTVDGMVQLAKAGKLTTDSIIEHLGHQNARLNADFAKAPVTLGVALTNIYSRLTDVSSRLFKMVSQSTAMGRAITFAFDLVVAAVKRFIAILGGADNALRLFSITLGVILTIKIVPMLLNLAKALWAIEAATWRAMIPWALWAAAIALIVLIIEDLWVWIKGGDSVIGDLVGSFDDFKAKMANVFTDLKDTIVKAFVDAWEWIKEVWNGALEFFVKLGTDIGTTFDNAWASVKTGFQTVITFFTTNIESIKTAFVNTFNYISNFISNIFNTIIATFEEWKNSIIGGINAVIEKIKSMFSIFGGTPATPGGTPGAAPTPGTLPSDPSGEVPIPTPRSQQWLPPPVLPFVTPGAVTPSAANTNVGPTNNNQANTINQNNNITVNLTPEQEQIASSIRAQMSGLTDEAINSMARQLAVSSPRNERAVQ